MRHEEEKQKPKLGSVGKIQTELYSKKTNLRPYSRKGFSDQDDASVSKQWSTPPKQEPELMEKSHKRKEPMTVFTKVLLLSIVFFIFSIGGAFTVFFYGQNDVTYDAVRLTVLGPNAVAGGEEIAFDVNVINDNPIDMVLTDIAVSYPKGTVTADAEGLPLTKDIASIEEIRSGFQETAKFKAILFGKEGDTKDINIVFQYRVPGSDNIFFRERTYTVLIESAPVIVSASHGSTYQTGSNVEIVIDVVSNATKRVRNLLLVVDYPFGFEFASSTPEAFDGESIFSLGDMRPGDSQQIIIRGSIHGQDDESRTFRYTLGAQSPERKNEIGSVFTFTETDMTIQRPPVKLTLTSDGNSDILQVIKSDSKLKFFLSYKNNLSSKIIDANLIVELAGQAYDRKDVFSKEGYYRSSTDSLLWSRTEMQELQSIDVGQSGVVEFELTSLTAREMAGLLQNPEIVITARLTGTNFEELGGEEQKIEGSVVKRLKVKSDVELDNKLLYSVGPIENQGPMQPTIGRLSTYTAHWKLYNSTNELSDAEVRAVIPRYVNFRDIVIPENASLTYNDRTREIIWQPGNVVPGAGYTAPAKEVYFGLVVEPSLDQLGISPTVMQPVTITATDTFTEKTITGKAAGVSTILKFDPDYDYRTTQVIEE